MKAGPGPLHPLLVRAYRLLLRCFPREVRREFGREMEEVLTGLYCLERRRRGTVGALWIVFLAYLEVPLRASVAHREGWQAARRERDREERSFRGRLRGGPRGIKPTLEGLREDLRQGTRRLAKTPGLTLVTVFSLAIGIGATTALFSVMDTAVLRGGPYAGPRELLNVLTHHRQSPSTTNSTHRDLQEIATLDDVFAEVGAFSGRLTRTREEGETRPIHVEGVTHNLLSMLGVQVEVGRTFLPEDDAAGATTPVAILNWEYWQRRFGGDPSAVGRVVEIAGRPFTIVGVTPERFRSLLAQGVRSDLLIPIATMAPRPAEGVREVYTDPRTWGMRIMGRLRPGITVEQARARLADLSGRLRGAQPDLYADRWFGVAPISHVMVHPEVDEALLSFGILLMTLAGLVLLLACTNLMSFLLAQGVELKKEIAIRLALGGRRGRLVTELLMEAALLVFMGALAGLLFAQWSLDLVAATLPSTDLSVIVDYGLITAELGLNRSVLLFSFGVAALTGALGGLVPALRSTKPEVGPTLRDEGVPAGTRRHGLQGNLVAVQVGVSVVLLVSGGLFLRSLQAAQGIDPGFRTREAGLLWVDLQASGIPPSEWHSVTDLMLAGAWSLPEVEAVGASTSVPLTVGAWSAQFFLPGVPPMEGQDGHWVLFTSIDPSFFEVMGISLVAGRGIVEPDQAGAEAVVVVNQAAVRRFWPEEDPLGKEIVALQSGLRYRVVGVVRDTKAESMDGSTRPLFHFAYAQFPTATVKLVARGPAAPGKVAASLRGAVRAVHPDLVILAETTLADQRSVLLLPARLAAGLLSLFGGLAAVLASLGLYGAVSSVVSCRTREVVIRISLGADTRDVVGTVVGGVMRTVLAGAAVGLAATFGLSRLLDRFLIGVGPHDLVTLTAVPLLLGVIALLAAFLPARRAARADPAGVLRYQ